MRRFRVVILVIVATIAIANDSHAGGDDEPHFRFECPYTESRLFEFSPVFRMRWPTGFTVSPGSNPTLELIREIHFSRDLSASMPDIMVFVQDVGTKDQDANAEVGAPWFRHDSLRAFRYITRNRNTPDTHYLAFAKGDVSLVVLSHEYVDPQSVVDCLEP